MLEDMQKREAAAREDRCAAPQAPAPLGAGRARTAPGSAVSGTCRHETEAASAAAPARQGKGSRAKEIAMGGAQANLQSQHLTHQWLQGSGKHMSLRKSP